MNKAEVSAIWKKLQVLGEKQGSIKLNDLASEMELAPQEALGFLRQVFPIGVGVEIYHQEEECWVDFKGEAIQYMLPLSPAEWMALHEILGQHRGLETPSTYSLKKKVTDNGPIKVVMELLSQLEQWDQELNDVQQVMVKKIEAAILDKMLVTFSTLDEKNYSVHPCKVLHLEGQLSLIAEDSQDHCLLVVPLFEMKNYEAVLTSSQSQVTPFEVDEFISALRSMNEKETRLILKIHEPESTNLFPDHHFLGKPCMITNPNGDLIWAAYVEPCEALYEWLLTLGRKVEILDPVNFKQDYLDYCEEKMRKIA